MDTKQLLHFMRETIRLRRAPGESMPWTSDPILGEWSFTKVKREDDRVPRWIAVSWREPQSRSVFFMTVARSVNWPATYARSAIRCPSGYGGVCRPRRPALRRRLYDPGGQQNLSWARDHKALNPLWRRMRPTPGLAIARYFARLSDFHSMGGGFMAGQVIADLKFVEPLTALGARLDDLRRGLNRVVGRPVKAISPRSRSGGQETTAPARVP